jgi:hypothetical protein
MSKRPVSTLFVYIQKICNDYSEKLRFVSRELGILE